MVGIARRLGYMVGLLRGQTLLNPRLGAAGNVDDGAVVHLREVLRRLGGTPAGLANYVHILGKVDLVRQSGKVGQGEVHGAGGVGGGELVGLADVDKRRASRAAPAGLSAVCTRVRRRQP